MKKSINIRIHEETHIGLKMIAAQEGRSLSDIIEEQMLYYIENMKQVYQQERELLGMTDAIDIAG